MPHLHLHLRNWLQTLQREEGQDLVEYTLLLGLLALICLVAISIGGQMISQIWNTVVVIVGNAMPGI